MVNKTQVTIKITELIKNKHYPPKRRGEVPMVDNVY